MYRTPRRLCPLPPSLRGLPSAPTSAEEKLNLYVYVFVYVYVHFAVMMVTMMCRARRDILTIRLSAAVVARRAHPFP